MRRLLRMAMAFPLLTLPAPVIAQGSELPADRGIDRPYPNCWDGICFRPTLEAISAENEHRKRLQALHEEGVRQRAIDGGTLTDEHHAALQTKLDRIQARYAEMRRRADWADTRARSRNAKRDPSG